VGDDEPPTAAGDVVIGAPVQAIARGGRGGHACAILADGDLRCWGRNDNGQLGYGHTNNIGDNETPASAGDVPVF
jgi:alpha-tubulin suppressor-like RCC1 family protein